MDRGDLGCASSSVSSQLNGRGWGGENHFSALSHGFPIYKTQVLILWISNLPSISDILRPQEKTKGWKCQVGLPAPCTRVTLPKVLRL